ncbi:MAG: class II fumarate hydratase [Anaerolineae bacterium]|nr:class II fumarate hydratase [Anaerolineae bacterium]
MAQSIHTSDCSEDDFRFEQDSLGEVRVPAAALWGAQTQRAVENFPISGIRFGGRFVGALGHVKRACALSNLALGTLDAALGGPIVQACDEMIAGELDAHFPIDIYQTGSGTSTNMNANEVLANRANQILNELHPVNKLKVHPNDHVNKSQSSNDVIPTAAHVALALALREDLIPSLEHLVEVLEIKAETFDGVVKTGRTHLQDATPIRMGQVFGGFAAQARYSVARARRAVVAVRELPLGGTAVGTGLNCPLGFPAVAIEHLNVALNGQFSEAANHVEANAARDGLVEASGLLKTIAVSLHKIANDTRWMASGPRNGLGELRVPAVQPGSSIMPGKVNPVIAEALIMVCAQVVGMDVANSLGGLGGAFELNLMMPLLAHNTLSASSMLANAARNFADRCIAGLEVDAEHCQSLVSRNLTLATALVPVIGYDRAAEIAKEAQRTGKTVREVALAQQVLPVAQLDALLDPVRMTEPGVM